jgi:hypothetical protein
MLASAAKTRAADTGWLQVGVRAWYVGGTSTEPGTPTSNAQEANLISRFEGGTVYVLQQPATDHWKIPLPATEWLNPKPAEEGVFWISPARLKAVAPGVGTGLLNWLGRQRLVYAKQAYTLDELPFLALLPQVALFALSPHRELVVLRNRADDPSDGDYFFDVETGLLLSKTEYLDYKTKTTLTLSEINYDFAARLAFAEDNGPHSAYAGRYSATRAAFLDNQGFDLYVPVISRYGSALLLTFNGNLMNVTRSQYFSFSYHMFYDALSQTAAIRPVATTAQATFTGLKLAAAEPDWQTNGTHIFCYVPPVDLQRESIQVWGLTLERQASLGGRTTFAAGSFPAEAAFTALTFDEQGYLADLTLVAPAMELNLDSSQAFERHIAMDGRDFYRTQMQPAVPSGSPLPLLGERPRLLIPPHTADQIRQHGVRLFLSGETNLAYVTEYSTDLVSWTPLATNLLATAEAELTDPSAAESLVRFYRARWLP